MTKYAEREIARLEEVVVNEFNQLNSECPQNSLFYGLSAQDADDMTAKWAQTVEKLIRQYNFTEFDNKTMDAAEYTTLRGIVTHLFLLQWYKSCDCYDFVTED